jgi:hypothetical protein
MQLTFIGFYINQILNLFHREGEELELDTLFNKDIEWFMLRAPSTDRDTYLRYRNNFLGSIEKGDSGQAVTEELLVRLGGLQMSDKQAARGSTKTQPASRPRRGNQSRGSQQPSNPPAPSPVAPNPPKRKQQQPTRPQQPQPQLQPPEGMNLGQKLNWYAQQGMEMPESAHRRLPRTKGNKTPPKQQLGADRRAWTQVVQRDDAASEVAQTSEDERSDTSASNARVTASLAAANQRTTYSYYPTPLLNRSIHAPIAPTKSTKLSLCVVRLRRCSNPVQPDCSILAQLDDSID